MYATMTLSHTCLYATTQPPGTTFHETAVYMRFDLVIGDGWSLSINITTSLKMLGNSFPKSELMSN